MVFLASFAAGTLKLHLQMQFKIENINRTIFFFFFFKSGSSVTGIGWIFPHSLGELSEQKYQGGRTSCISKFSLLQLQSPASPPPPPPRNLTKVLVWLQ